jgi:hypothetical protein
VCHNNRGAKKEAGLIEKGVTAAPQRRTIETMTGDEHSTNSNTNVELRYALIDTKRQIYSTL